MAVQTSYEIEHAGAVAGAVVDGTLKNIVSGAAVGSIPFGRVVYQTGTGVVLPLSTTGQVTSGLAGIAIRVQDDVANASDALQYEDESDVSVLDFGTVWMVAEDAVAAGGAVFARFVAGGLGVGSVRSDADAGDAVALPGAMFMAAAGAGALVPVRYRA